MKLDRLSLLIGGAMGAVAAIVVSGTGVGVEPATAQQDVLSAIQRTQAMAVIYQLDTTGFHDLEVDLSSGQVPAGALGKVRRARIAAQATNWPGEVASDAASMVEAMQQLESGLRDEDASKAQPPAKEVHDLEHDLSTKMYAWLSAAQPGGSH